MRNLKHHCRVLTHMVSLAFLSETICHKKTTWQLVHSDSTPTTEKTFQRAAMEYSSGKLAIVRRLCTFEGYFRQ